MKAKIAVLLRRYREMLMYLIFGVLTTLVNIVSYYCLTRFILMDTAAATALAWFLSVVFAYVTNRRWVFRSKATGFMAIVLEAGGFFAARAATGLMDLGVMALCVDVMHLPDMPVKIASNVIVVILNYVLSKLLIFRKGRKQHEK